jgi:hypothetical protein
MALTNVFYAVIVLFLEIILGFFLVKIRIFDDGMVKRLSRFIGNVTLPALIISALNFTYDPVMMKNASMILVSGLGYYLLATVMAWAYMKMIHVKPRQEGVHGFALIFANVGFMGYPVIQAIYGQEGLFYAAIYNIWFNVFLYTIGIFMLSKHQKKGNHFQIKTMLTNPNLIALTIGLICFVFSIDKPQPIDMVFEQIGGLTTPLAMLTVGAMLGGSSIREMAKNRMLWLTSFLRMVWMPLVTYFVLKQCGLDGLTLGIPVVMAGMPAAANGAIFAQIYDADYQLSSQTVFLTTLLSVVSIPLLVLLLS